MSEDDEIIKTNVCVCETYLDVVSGMRLGWGGLSP